MVTSVTSNIAITLPDGSVREFDRPVTGLEIAQSIGPRLAKDALAVKLDGEVKDLTTTVTTNAKIEIVTRSHPDALEVIRHDAAHVLADAVQKLYPGTQVTIGPAIANGFYYDFAREEPFTPDDLEKIEAKMREIVAKDIPILREVWTRDDAIAYFKKLGEHYKAELIEAIPADQDISVYRQDDWLDLCRGPHAPTTGKVGNGFKLMKVAGAYWRGDSRNPMLQRIYGTAWRDEKELKAYLHQLEEAEKRDHRRLGKELDLFHVQEEAVGSVFWHPKGWTLFRTLETYIRTKLSQADYVEVKTPQLIDSSLFKASGHWDMYGDNMFKVSADDGEKMLGIKPMNCPGHVQIFKHGLRSYRDLPIRMAEFGACHRNEPSGALHGILRVRAFTQDDAHIFCTEDQVPTEAADYFKLQLGVYRDLGFDKIAVKLALRPDVRAGNDAVWDRAEEGLRTALRSAGLEFEELPGEGAFYGPKVEFHLTDAIGRTWQCGTLQLDFVLPERLDASYIGEDGARHRPVMLHRAILGSLERFIGMLIEHYAGKFPMWLAPVQAVVCTITNEADGYGQEVVGLLKRRGIRAALDTRNEKINLKVREHSLQKVPVLVVVGKREAEERTVALRTLGGKDQEVLALDAALNKLNEEARSPAGAAVFDSPF
ncbi:threonine--tRNA ligase [Azospirillum sp. YIM DDC1]|uniref:Threonine--tRNA ligase n=1 Tax=Azospirillum aestuarii TaxID=2802052 RepID=A0ABS1HUG7_9PROT|nr:threonine--tRNA ligase [Azospirillum aestuarii]MBK3777058.1 threonine--tRNA ligase [Azospirillum brasilense]MBK4718471.1 threonine--tRNA ligase [Azospirillum aestuarii]TWA95091.1 threonyl-tRNA synthetase [Azospirillum brasilense]